MKLYLVENYTPGLKFDNDSLIIGLTPLACYQLGKAGIDYKIWEDYVDISGFARQCSEYYCGQKLWLKEFDEFLMKIFPQANLIKLPLATTYCYYLTSTIGSLVLRANELQALFKQVNPRQVIYVSQSPKKDIINFTLLFRGNIEGLFSQLAPLICKKQGILFERITIIPSNIKSNGAKKLSIIRWANNKKLLKTLWGDLQIIRLWTKAKKINRSGKSAKLNILFLEQNSYLRKIMVEAIKQGHKVYYKFANSIIRQYCGFHLTECRINDKKKGVEFAPNLELLSKKLREDTNLINWLNQVCEINVESVILPRLLHFIEVTSPEIIFLTNEYAKIYDSLKIRLVFLTYCSTLTDHAAVAACKYSQKIKVGCISHGDGVFDSREFLDDYVSPYDIFFVSDDEIAEYLKKRKAEGKFNTNILQAPIRYAILPPKKPLKSKAKKNKPRVVFVPTVYPWDNNNWTAVYPDTWYFHWHKQLLEFFGKRTDFEFIWKAFPASTGIYDPNLDVIKEKKYPNIRYETSPFPNWIPKADRVLLDYPSTALYEAAFAGLPVMSLYFVPFCRIRKTAAEIFGKSLQPFSNFSEGIQKVSAFLDADASQFIANIPHSNQPFINLLNSINYSERGNK